MQEASWKRGQAGRTDSLNENFSVCSPYATPLGPPAQAKYKGSIDSSECHSQGSRAMKCAPRAG